MEADADIYDTRDQYKLEIVSFGWDDTVTLDDGIEIYFENNLITSNARFDERNLFYCKYLNIQCSSITELDTIYLSNLEVLILNETKIDYLNIDNLVNL